MMMLSLDLKYNLSNARQRTANNPTFIVCPKGTYGVFAEIQHTESYAALYVIVRTHYVIMSMDALACPVGTNRIYFEI